MLKGEWQKSLKKKKSPKIIERKQIFNYIFKLEFSVFEMLVVSIVSALLELFDKKGLDNLFVPLAPYRKHLGITFFCRASFRYPRCAARQNLRGEQI